MINFAKIIAKRADQINFATDDEHIEYFKKKFMTELEKATKPELRSINNDDPRDQVISDSSDPIKDYARIKQDYPEVNDWVGITDGKGHIAIFDLPWISLESAIVRIKHEFNKLGK